ncbi:unnamed protein product, partial [Pylaiella littoralis]
KRLLGCVYDTIPQPVGFLIFYLSSTPQTVACCANVSFISSVACFSLHVCSFRARFSRISASEAFSVFFLLLVLTMGCRSPFEKESSSDPSLHGILSVVNSTR